MVVRIDLWLGDFFTASVTGAVVFTEDVVPESEDCGVDFKVLLVVRDSPVEEKDMLFLMDVQLSLVSPDEEFVVETFLKGVVDL